MAARHYDGRFWAKGETALDSQLTETRNAIAKLHKKIAAWTVVLNNSPEPRSAAQAERQIDACRWFIARHETYANEVRARIEQLFPNRQEAA